MDGRADADEGGPEAQDGVRPSATCRRLAARSRATLAGGWHDVPSVAARLVAPLREIAEDAQQALCDRCARVGTWLARLRGPRRDDR